MSKSIFINSRITEKTPFNKSQKSIEMNELYFIERLLKTQLAIYTEMTINAYYSGDFEKVLQLLPKEKLEELMKTLQSYKKNAIQFPTYEKVRSLLKLYLEGLIKCVTQYLDMLNLNAKLDECKERCTILDDMKKLQEYIDKLQTAMRIFNPPPQTVDPARILQEHATYLRMYGYPVGGIFDVEKLNNIILNQKAAAVIAAKTING
jgi:hypothetical protein